MKDKKRIFSVMLKPETYERVRYEAEIYDKKLSELIEFILLEAFKALDKKRKRENEKNNKRSK